MSLNSLKKYTKIQRKIKMCQKNRQHDIEEEPKEKDRMNKKEKTW